MVSLNDKMNNGIKQNQSLRLAKAKATKHNKMWIFFDWVGGNFGSVRDKTSATRTKNQITVTYAKDLEKSCVINIKTRRRITHALRSEKPEYGIFLLKLNAFVASAAIPFCMEMNGHATKAEAKTAPVKRGTMG